jgi:hypothetical protein
MFGLILSAVLCLVPPTVDTRPLLDAMYVVESTSGKNLVGDGGRAIGPYQIWREYWQDAVEHDPSIGGSYRDCMDKAYSERIIRAYWARYAPKGATVEQLARIHNGGPKGHRLSGTLKYWRKIVKAMRG